MRNSKIEYCKVTGKYCYSSEAKATRAMNKYKDIRRIYFCEHCNNFHTTSIGRSLAIKEGIIEDNPKVEVSKEDIKKEIKRLKEKISKSND